MLEKQVLKSVGWSAAGVWVRAVVSIVTLVILARLLAPEDYGAFALSYLVVGAFSLLASGPLAEAIIQGRSVDPVFERATFWLTICMGGIAWGLALLTASFWSLTFGVPVLAVVIPIFGINGMSLALGSVPAARLMRELRYDALNVVEVAAAVIGSAAGLVLAWNGAGVWSLVTMEIVGGAVRAMGLWRCAPLRPGWTPHLSEWPRVVRENWGAVGAWTLRYGSTHIPRGIIGSVLGPAILGFYVFANRLFERVAGLLLQPIGSVALSAVSRAQDDRETLHGLLAQGLRLSSLICAPAFLGLAAIVPILIPTVFGARWADAIVPAQLLLLIGIRAAIGAFNISILRGVGQHAAPVGLLAFETGMLALVLPFAATYGLVAACYAILAIELIAAPVAAYLVSRATGFSIGQQILAAGPGLAGAVPMALCVVGLRRMFETALSPVLLMLVCTLVGALLYLVIIRVVAPDTSRAAMASLRAFRSGKPAI